MDTRLAELALEVDGGFRVVPCMRLTLYLDTTEAGPITEYCNAALTLLGSRLTHYQTGSMKRPAQISAKADGLVASWFRRPREYQTYWACLEGGQVDGVSDSMVYVLINYRPLEVLSAEELEGRRSRLRVLYEERGSKTFAPVSEITVTLPLDDAAAQPENLLRWLLARPLIGETPFASGHAGIGLNYDATIADMATRFDIESRIAYAIARHPGIDWHKGPILDQLNRYDPRTRDRVPHIKRVNWLTLVSDRGLAALGEPAAILDRLQSRAEVTIHRLRHGVLIQAGAKPELGDSNTGDLSPALRHVGQILRPIRLPTMGGEGRGLSDGVAQRWLEAFDT